MITQDRPAVFDRTVQVAKLRTDLKTSTAHAEQCGVPITTIVRNLLEMAEWWCGVASDRGVDLSALGRIGGVRPMIAALWFAAGIVTGIIATIGIGIAIINRPLPERERPIYSVNGGRSTRTTGPELTFDFIQRRLR